MSTITTALAPSFAKDLAIAFPSPRAPPVMKATPGVFGPFRYAMSSEDRATEPMTKKILNVARPGWDYYLLFLVLCPENLAMSGVRSSDIVKISTCYLF